jgi:regulator of RNase E activity RraB
MTCLHARTQQTVSSLCRSRQSRYLLCMSGSDDKRPKSPSPQDLPPYEREGYEVLDGFDSPAEGDRLVLEQLLKRGANLSKVRHVVHYFYFSEEPDRLRAEIQLQGAGYKTRFGVDVPNDQPYCLIAERTGLVNDELIRDERERLTQIAEEANGEYDGWEAQLD